MNDFIPCDPQFRAWWKLYFGGDRNTMAVETLLAMYWSVSMESQQRLGEVPRPDLW